MKRSLILTSAQAGTGKKLQKTFTDVNQSVEGSVMKTALQMINNLTTNTYVQSDVIDKINLDTEIPPVDTRQTPTFSMTQTEFQANNISGNNIFQAVTYNGDGIIYAYRTSGCEKLLLGVSASSNEVVLRCSDSNHPSPGTFIVAATGTENYKPAEIECTVV